MTDITEHKLPWEAMGGRRTMWRPIVYTFVLPCILVWLNETLDIPHLLLGAPPTPINWQEAISETILIAAVGAFGVSRLVRNITEREQAEEALRENECKYRTLFEASTDAIFLETLEGRVLDCNTSACEMFDYTREELTGLTVADLVPEEIAKTLPDVIAAELATGGICIEAANKRKDGTVFPVEVSTRVVTLGGEQLVVAYVRDITEHKRAEESLIASDEYTRNVIDSSLDMIITCDMERNIVEFNKAAEETFGYRREEVIGQHVDLLYADLHESLLVHETTIREGKCVREVLDRRQNGEEFPAFLSASVLREANGEIVGVMGVARDVTARKQATDALQQRNRELAMINRASRVLVSTLDLDQVLATVLEEVRRLLNVVACSVWLTEPGTDELVCKQATGPQSEMVRGWRLSSGQGIAGWVISNNESLIVPDTMVDERYFTGVDQQTGLALRAILSVPLQVKKDVIGALQVVDTEVNRFDAADLGLLEPLVAVAATAIENARLYEQARRDAETKSMLLREVNHRVKNNLTAIAGLLYAERRHADAESYAIYQSIIRELVNRVQGLATVHSLLSASGWTPLSLSKLTTQVIRSALQMLPRDKHVTVDVTPSSVRVTSDQAHDLALVINELATNTVKHALQERGTGHITVCIETKDDTVQFQFQDDGPGYPEQVLLLERYSVGFDLIQNVVRQSLRGELSLHNDRGAVAVVRFPLQV
ncbi:MAG: PAS domain S-box protein [Chloroflexota bacterium]|nr:PAS domain S-box protein [Chloroflexota bacterium]